MSFHGPVAAVIRRLVATMLVALLVGPGLAMIPRALADMQHASSAADTGVNPPSAPAVSALVSVAPAALAAPLSVTPRVIEAVPPAWGVRPSNPTLRSASAAKSAPTILRV
jgi:hypothetical protein